jgi:hypothetical protein
MTLVMALLAVVQETAALVFVLVGSLKSLTLLSTGFGVKKTKESKAAFVQAPNAAFAVVVVLLLLDSFFFIVTK